MGDLRSDMELKSVDKSEPNEGDAFIRNGQSSTTKEPPPSALVNCCRSKHTSRCFIAVSVIGVIFIILGVVVLILGEPLLEKKILKTMALTPGSDRTESWLHPPVDAHLTAYAFHVTNPEAVLAGKKPILEERGPFVYKATTLKDTDNNMHWSQDNSLLTYRQRKIYTYVPELSAEDFKDPNLAFVTVPNIPFWTGLKKAGGSSIGIELVKSNGGITPFINVSINGLIWGYAGSELPCLSLELPQECKSSKHEDVGFSDSDADFEDFGDDDTAFGGDKKEEPKKVSASSSESAGPTVDTTDIDDDVPNFKVPADSTWEKYVKPHAQYVNCSCEWGLFRDRNVTMRQPITFFTGVSDLRLKGQVLKYDRKSTFGWWKEGSSCDRVKGQDASTLYPGIQQDDQIEIFIDTMCRTLKMQYELENEHAGIRTLRFIPPANTFGTHDDPDPTRVNKDNECYCMGTKEWPCHRSGVMSLAACKRKTNPPLAISFPHFYQAHPSYLEAVSGLNPKKERHEFYMDVVPEFGFPLAIRPRFQLNIVMFREPKVKELKNMQEELILPFLWAEDGFSEPSDKMADAIRFGLNAPKKLPMFIAIVCFVIGAIALLTVLVYFLWRKRDTVGSKDIS